MARKDIHRPAAIEPADYEFVAFDYLPNEGDPLGAAMFMMEQRKYKRAHMEKSGGFYSQHEHGGLCHICGSVNAIYSASFYHAKSNSYIKAGLDCAQKLECHGIEAFRKSVKKGLEASKGKSKAKAVLEKIGAGAAWSLYEADAEYRKAFAAESKAWQEANPEAEPDRWGNVEGAPKYKQSSKDESVVLDMVSRLIKYGDISDKAQSYLKVLLERIEKAPEIAAAKAAEAALAKPVPAAEGRMLIEGEIVSLKLQEGFYGSQLKMLVKHADGWKLWGSCPAAIAEEAAKGDKVQLLASVQRSQDDPAFGFFSRPSKPKLIKQEVAA